MTNLKINKIILNNGVTLDLNPDDIVVFLGPNNSGKSRALKDIHSSIFNPETPGIVVSKVECKINDKERIEHDLKDFSVLSRGDYQGAGFKVYGPSIKRFIDKEIITEGITNFLTSFLSTEQRLSLVTPPERITPDEPRTHPFHYLDQQRNLIDQIGGAFLEAFGKHLLLNEYNGRHLSLSVADGIIQVDDKDKGLRIEQFNEFMRRQFADLPHLHEQGDGMKSFTGILLNFFVEHYSIFFIDEPESFLHPPQAYVIASQLVSMSEGRQVFISTHSEQFLKGLVDTQTSRVKIIRVTRTKDTNYFSVIENARVKQIWDDPLLRYSNIMNAMFYDVAVIYESNADCKFYRLLTHQIMENQKRHFDPLFIESGGKQRLAIVCEAFKEMGIDFRVTPDFDIFRQEEQAKRLFESCGGDWAHECAADWHIIDDSLPEGEQELDREAVRERLNNLLDRAMGESLNSQDIRKLREALKGQNKWDGPKYEGLKAISEGEPRNAAIRLLQKFNSKCIFPVPSGEMESLVPDSRDHGKDWLNIILTKFPDLNDRIYANARDYISSLNL